jgi:hypothetical protein
MCEVASADDETPTFPSFCVIELSPMCVGLNGDPGSWSLSPDCAWYMNNKRDKKSKDYSHEDKKIKGNLKSFST